MKPKIKVDLFTFRDVRGSESLTELGRIWDRYPELVPEVVDQRDPPRKRYGSVAEAFAEVQGLLDPVKGQYRMLCRFGPGGADDLTMFGELEPDLGWRRPFKLKTPSGWRKGESLPGPSSVKVSWDLDLLPSGVDQVVDLFVEAAQHLEAYVGSVYTRAQLPSRDYAHFGDRQGVHSLPVPGWVNLYGPAFVEFFGGVSVFDGVGVRRELLDTGAVVVWLTDEPLPVDPGTLRPFDVSWIVPLVDAIGRDRFVSGDHADAFEWIEAEGVKLPRIAEHQAFTTPWEGA